MEIDWSILTQKSNSSSIKLCVVRVLTAERIQVTRIIPVNTMISMGCFGQNICYITECVSSRTLPLIFVPGVPGSDTDNRTVWRSGNDLDL